MSTLQRTFKAATPQSPAGPLNATHPIGRSLVRHVSHEIFGRMTGKPELSETHSRFLVGRLHWSNFSQARFWSTYGLPIIVTSHSRVSGLTAPTCGSWKCPIDVLPLHVIFALRMRRATAILALGMVKPRRVIETLVCRFE